MQKSSEIAFAPVGVTQCPACDVRPSWDRGGRPPTAPWPRTPGYSPPNPLLRLLAEFLLSVPHPGASPKTFFFGPGTPRSSCFFSLQPAASKAGPDNCSRMAIGIFFSTEMKSWQWIRKRLTGFKISKWHLPKGSNGIPPPTVCKHLSELATQRVGSGPVIDQSYMHVWEFIATRWLLRIHHGPARYPPQGPSRSSEAEANTPFPMQYLWANRILEMCSLWKWECWCFCLKHHIPRIGIIIALNMVSSIPPSNIPSLFACRVLSLKTLAPRGTRGVGFMPCCTSTHLWIWPLPCTSANSLGVRRFVIYWNIP